MKKIAFYIFLLSTVVLSSCIKEVTLDAGFKDINKLTIYDFLEQNKDDFSSFISILQKGGIYKTLSAKNPKAAGYTLFLPNNNAVEAFISENQNYSSLNDLLNDQEYVSALCRFHVLRKGINTNEFPFGAFPETTLSNDFLTVSFILETDTAYYKINNQAAVIRPNIEVSNGYVHVVQSVLNPVVYTTYGWLDQHSEFSIFKAAVDLTGIRTIIDINLKAPGQEFQPAVTLFAESDQVYNKYGIFSVEDLVKKISPNNSEYEDEVNPLKNYMAYHVLRNRIFIDEFEGVSSNYNTYSEIPLLVNGIGNDIAINKGKLVPDTIVAGTDTTIIDFIGILYDESNVITQSGAIHFIDRIMEQKTPTRSNMEFQFKEEPFINSIRATIGTYLLDDYKENLNRLSWNGAKLSFIREGTESSASNDDYLMLDGDFSIFYTIPEIVQGKYSVVLRAESFSRRNALIEVFIDGKKIGPTFDLTAGGSANAPFRSIELGTVNFNRYTEHIIKIRSLTPGRFLWDYIQFTPI